MGWEGFHDDIDAIMSRRGLAMVLCGALGDSGDKVGGWMRDGG